MDLQQLNTDDLVDLQQPDSDDHTRSYVQHTRATATDHPKSPRRPDARMTLMSHSPT
jgi:hypothetical protein